MGARWPQPQDGPTWPQDDPGWPQDGPRRAQEGPRMSQDGVPAPKMALRYPGQPQGVQGRLSFGASGLLSLREASAGCAKRVQLVVPQAVARRMPEGSRVQGWDGARLPGSHLHRYQLSSAAAAAASGTERRCWFSRTKLEPRDAPYYVCALQTLHAMYVLQKNARISSKMRIGIPAHSHICAANYKTMRKAYQEPVRGGIRRAYGMGKAHAWP